MQVVFYCGNLTESVDLNTIEKQKSISNELCDWLKRNQLEYQNNNVGFYYKSSDYCM